MSRLTFPELHNIKTLCQSNLPPSSFKLKNKGTGDEFVAGKMYATEPRNTRNTV